MPWNLGRAAREQGWAWVYASIAVCALLCLPARAQTAGPSNEPAAEVTASVPQVHLNADEVLIDLVVRDKKKRPVLDLTPQDIAVSDSGKPVELSALHLVNGQAGAASIGLVFDRMRPESAKVAGDIAAQLIALAPQRCSFAVLGLDQRLRLYQNFTEDGAAVKTAIGAALGSETGSGLTEAEKQLVSISQAGAFTSGTNASVEERAKAAMMLSAIKESQQIVEDQHTLPALAGLQALAKAQQNLPGRKILVFFSDGLRADSKVETMTRDVVETANRAGVGIYTVDTDGVTSKSLDSVAPMTWVATSPLVYAAPGTAGLTPGFESTLQGASIPKPGGMQRVNSQWVDSLESERRFGGANSLSFLANGTGGFRISAGDDMHEPLERLIGDIATYYEASYAPDLKDYDGQFHSIDIRPLRAGVTIRARAGYFALAPGAGGSFGVRPFEAPLLKILSDSPLPVDVGFKQAVLCLGGAESRPANELVIEVPLANLELRQDQHTLLYSASLSILAQIKDEHGVVIERFSEDISRNGALETIEAARAGFVTLQRHFNAAPGRYAMEAAVLDHMGERAGAQRVEFTVPAAADGPWLSDVALVRRTEGSPDPMEPMQYAKERVVPNLAGQVSAGTPRISFFFMIHPDTGLSGRDGQLELDVQRDGKSVLKSSTEIAPGTVSDNRANLVGIDAKALPAGNYRAVFGYTQGDKRVTRDLAFTVDGNGVADAETQPETADKADKANADAGSGSGAGVSSPLLVLDSSRFVRSPSSSSAGPPSKKYLNALVAGARERARGYVDSLVNFRCLEVTDRFVDAKGTGSWTGHDKIVEMVTYENQAESRTVLEVDGQTGVTQAYGLESARLEGAFGAVLKTVFDPASKAELEWKETDQLDGAATQVFSYRVDAKNSSFVVSALPKPDMTVGFHGLVYIDDATRGIRRITMEAEGIPAGYPVRASAVAIDYDYIAINNHDYLMPVGGEMRMKVGKLEDIMHKIEFRDYHRFGSDARIVGFNP